MPVQNNTFTLRKSQWGGFCSCCCLTNATFFLKLMISLFSHGDMSTVFTEVYSTTCLRFFMTSFTSNTGGRQHWCLLLSFKSAQTVAISTVGQSEFRKYNRANQLRHFVRFVGMYHKCNIAFFCCCHSICAQRQHSLMRKNRVPFFLRLA